LLLKSHLCILMEQKFDENTIYRNIKPADLQGQDRIFEDCQFINCDLSYANLSHFTFINCVMDTCNLSLIKITDTGFQSVDFKDCKITGVNFGDSSNFSLEVSFTKCVLDYTVWHKKKLKGTLFDECSFEEADFSETDLTNSVLQKCNLNRAIFNRTILKGADLRTAYNFNIDPENNTITKAKFSADALSGLLIKYNLVIE
jgi:fluoroquinolone resistance protein